VDQEEDFFLPEEAVEWIGRKKSEYLSQLIENAEKDDFSFEEIHNFNELVPTTIGEPDRSYQDDADDYPVRTFVRTYEVGEQFHQVVIGGVFLDPKSQNEVVVPILVFVSRKEKLVSVFLRGESVQRQVLN
jgi:hypothetical protein